MGMIIVAHFLILPRVLTVMFFSCCKTRKSLNNVLWEYQVKEQFRILFLVFCVGYALRKLSILAETSHGLSFRL